MKNNKKNKYPYLDKLGIPIYKEPVSYIKHKELLKKLNKKEQALFHKYFGIQTCPYIKGGELYPCDAEAVLVRIFENRLTFSQLYWD